MGGGQDDHLSQSTPRTDKEFISEFLVGRIGSGGELQDGMGGWDLGVA